MPEKPLIFIDTNILLDFYQLRSVEASLGFLKHIDDNREAVITTNQVEMEYKKNRQRVILDSLKNVQEPNWNSFQVPAYLQGSRPHEIFEKARAQIKKQGKSLRNRISKLLVNPAQNDKVYQTAQRLFLARTEYHLTRQTKSRRLIRQRALRRFLLGYPPRKQSDTSYGDAVNWEWIVDCAQRSGRDVIIVSRDSDYGSVFNKRATINDWLLHEFKDRTSRRRSVRLTDRLADAFRRVAVSVTREEEESEEALLKDQIVAQSHIVPSHLLRNYFANMSEAMGRPLGSVQHFFLKGISATEASNRLESIICERHGRPIEFIVRAAHDGRTEAEVEGCCPFVLQEAERAIT